MKLEAKKQRKVLFAASVASMIDQFNMQNIRLVQDMGYEVHVACNFMEGNTCDRKRIQKVQKKMENMGVIWHQWDCPRNVMPVWKCCRAYRQLWELAVSCRFAWMHCHSPVGGALARIVAHQRGIRVVYTAHGFHFYKGAPWKNWFLYYPVEKLLAGWTDVLVVVNKEDYRFARTYLKAGRVCYLPGVGIDWKHFADYVPTSVRRVFCESVHIPEDAKILLSVGELSIRKNHQFAVSLLSGLDPDTYYLLCGQGGQRQVLADIALREGVRERVRFLGYQEDLRVFYHYADIFVFPSLQEGLPVALMEAMASGLPCIVSDIRGNREMVSDAIPLKQAERFRKAVKLLLDDEKLRQECGKRNQQQARKYGWAAVERRTKEIYAEMDTMTTGSR